jgi:hypothetical protein
MYQPVTGAAWASVVRDRRSICFITVQAIDLNFGHRRFF